MVSVLSELLRSDPNPLQTRWVVLDNSGSAFRYLGFCSACSTEEEGLPHEETPSANGWQGFEGCEESQYLLGLWTGETRTCSVPTLCSGYDSALEE